MLTIKGIYGREMFETWYAMAAMLQTNATLRERVESVVTDVIAAADWKRGFDAARAACHRQDRPGLEEPLMYAFKDQLAAELDELRESGLYKRERAITTRSRRT